MVKNAVEQEFSRMAIEQGWIVNEAQGVSPVLKTKEGAPVDPADALDLVRQIQSKLIQFDPHFRAVLATSKTPSGVDGI